MVEQLFDMADVLPLFFRLLKYSLGVFRYRKTVVNCYSPDLVSVFYPLKGHRTKKLQYRPSANIGYPDSPLNWHGQRWISPPAHARASQDVHPVRHGPEDKHGHRDLKHAGPSCLLLIFWNYLRPQRMLCLAITGDKKISWLFLLDNERDGTTVLSSALILSTLIRLCSIYFIIPMA